MEGVNGERTRRRGGQARGHGGTATATSLQGEAATGAGRGSELSPSTGQRPTRGAGHGRLPCRRCRSPHQGGPAPSPGSGAETQGTCSQGDPTSPATCALALYLVTSLKTELSPFPSLPPRWSCKLKNSTTESSRNPRASQPGRERGALQGAPVRVPSPGQRPRTTQPGVTPEPRPGIHDLHPKAPCLRPGHQSSTADGPASTSSEPGLWIWF